MLLFGLEVGDVLFCVLFLLFSLLLFITCFCEFVLSLLLPLEDFPDIVEVDVDVDDNSIFFLLSPPGLDLPLLLRLLSAI